MHIYIYQAQDEKRGNKTERSNYQLKQPASHKKDSRTKNKSNKSSHKTITYPITSQQQQNKITDQNHTPQHSRTATQGLQQTKVGTEIQPAQPKTLFRIEANIRLHTPFI
jgi:hypothetical protein